MVIKKALAISALAASQLANATTPAEIFLSGNPGSFEFKTWNELPVEVIRDMHGNVSVLERNGSQLISPRNLDSDKNVFSLAEMSDLNDNLGNLRENNILTLIPNNAQGVLQYSLNSNGSVIQEQNTDTVDTQVAPLVGNVVANQIRRNSTSISQGPLIIKPGNDLPEGVVPQVGRPIHIQYNHLPTTKQNRAYEDYNNAIKPRAKALIDSPKHLNVYDGKPVIPNSDGHKDRRITPREAGDIVMNIREDEMGCPLKHPSVNTFILSTDGTNTFLDHSKGSHNHGNYCVKPKEAENLNKTTPVKAQVVSNNKSLDTYLVNLKGRGDSKSSPYIVSSNGEGANGEQTFTANRLVRVTGQDNYVVGRNSDDIIENLSENAISNMLARAYAEPVLEDLIQSTRDADEIGLKDDMDLFIEIAHKYDTKVKLRCPQDTDLRKCIDANAFGNLVGVSIVYDTAAEMAEDQLADMSYRAWHGFLRDTNVSNDPVLNKALSLGLSIVGPGDDYFSQSVTNYTGRILNPHLKSDMKGVVKHCVRENLAQNDIDGFNSLGAIECLSDEETGLGYYMRFDYDACERNAKCRSRLRTMEWF